MFFEVAVTPERVAAAFADIAGSEFAMEPIAQGPGKIAKVSANVKIQEPRVTRRLGDSITFVIHIPLAIDLLLDLWLDKQRFVVSGDIAIARDRTRGRTAVADCRRRQTAAVRHHRQCLVQVDPRRGIAHPGRGGR